MSGLQEVLRARISGGAPPAKRRRSQAAAPAASASRVDRVFRGQYSAVVTPLCDDLTPKLSVIDAYAEMLHRDGLNGVFVGGTAGGSMSLSVPERKALLEEWVRVGPKHSIEVIAHIGAQSLADTCELARHAEQHGALGISAMSPSFFKPGSVDALADFIALVAEAAPDTPFLYYHFPEITGVSFSMAQTFAALHPRVPTLRGAKFTSTNAWDLGDTLDLGRKLGANWTFFNGYEGMTSSVVPLGIGAHIGISFSVVGPVWNRLIRAAEAGDYRKAEEEQRIGREWFKMFADISGLWSMAAATKLMLSWRLGRDLGGMRPPQKDLTPDQKMKLKTAWDAMRERYPGLLDHSGVLQPVAASASNVAVDQLPGMRGGYQSFLRERVRRVAKNLGVPASEVFDVLPHIQGGGLRAKREPAGSIADYIDHTILKPDADGKAIAALCNEAARHKFKAVCVNPCRVPECHARLQSTRVAVAAVVGFPLGASSTEVKIQEAQLAEEAGAREIDLVLNVGQLKDDHLDLVLEETQNVIESVKIPVKVILETCLLSDEQIADACILCAIAGAEFVKTSTGFSKGGATLHAVDLMKSAVGDVCQVKASGGIRDAATAKAFIAVGADRIGTSCGVDIVRGC